MRLPSLGKYIKNSVLSLADKNRKINLFHINFFLFSILSYQNLTQGKFKSHK